MPSTPADAQRLLTALGAFESSYARMFEHWRRSVTIYCVGCGRLYPDGVLSRVMYGSVHYADEKCPECQATGAGNEALRI